MKTIDTIKYTKESTDDHIYYLENELDYVRFPRDFIILSKIEPKNTNAFVNPETEFPIKTELSSAMVEFKLYDGDALVNKLNKMGSGWIYSDPLILKRGDTIKLFDETITFKMLLSDGIHKRIVFENKDGHAISMDLNNTAFIGHIYDEISPKGQKITQRTRQKFNS